MMPSTSRSGDGGLSNSSGNSDISDSVSPSLIIVQKKFNILFEEVQKKNAWTLEIANQIDNCLFDFLNEFQQRRQNRICNDAFVSDVFDNLQYILSRFLVPPGYMLGSLNSTLAAIIKLTTVLAHDENLCETLRDSYGMLQVLTDVFNSTMTQEDITLILTCIKALTKDLVISWKAPYLYKLVDQLYTFIETKFDDKPRMYVVLQILINLCRRNVSCVLIAHEHSKSRKIWRQLNEGLKRDTKACDLQEVLITHFMLIVTSCIRPTDFYSWYEIIEVLILQAFTKYEHTTSYQAQLATLLEAISDVFCSIADKIRPIYQQCESFLINDATSDQAKLLLDGKKAYLTFAEKITTQLALFFQTHGGRNTFEESFESSVLRLLISTLPPFIPMKNMLKSYLASLEITERVFTNNFDAQDITKMCLKLYTHVADQLDKADDVDRQKFKEVETLLKTAISKLELDSGRVSPWNMEVTGLTLRLFSTLSKQTAFSEKILQRLKPDAMKYTIQSLTNSTGPKEKDLSQRSACIIEILFLMAQHTREVAIFDLMMQLMSLPDISLHVAKCINSGDESIVSKALVVIGSVGFANNNLPSISKNIVALRNHASREIENDVVLESHAGVKRVHDVIRAVNVMAEFENTTKKNKKDNVLLSKVLSCYQLDQELHEREFASLNSQIVEAKYTIKSLNSLTKKQRHVMNNLLLEKERTTEQMGKLQVQVEKAELESKSLNSETQQEILRLKSELASEKKAIVALNKSIQEKEGTLKKLQDNLEAITEERDGALTAANTLREEKRSLANSLTKTKTELETAHAKCAELEQDVAAKKKEIVNARNQLDQQIKMVNTIRGVLGNNTFGGLLGNP